MSYSPDERCTIVNDADYTVGLLDGIVEYDTLTVSRIVNLPAIANVAIGFSVFINDGSGAASATVKIQVRPNGTEKIDGEDGIDIIAPYAGICIYRGGTQWLTKWSD